MHTTQVVKSYPPPYQQSSRGSSKRCPRVPPGDFAISHRHRLHPYNHENKTCIRSPRITATGWGTKHARSSRQKGNLAVGIEGPTREEVAFAAPHEGNWIPQGTVGPSI